MHTVTHCRIYDVTFIRCVKDICYILMVHFKHKNNEHNQFKIKCSNSNYEKSLSLLIILGELLSLSRSRSWSLWWQYWSSSRRSRANRAIQYCDIGGRPSGEKPAEVPLKQAWIDKNVSIDISVFSYRVAIPQCPSAMPARGSNEWTKSTGNEAAQTGPTAIPFTFNQTTSSSLARKYWKYDLKYIYTMK